MNISAARILKPRKALWTILVMAGALAGLQGAQDSDSAITLKRDTQPLGREQEKQESTSFSNIVKRVSPTVVKITTQVSARKLAAAPPGFPGFDGERGAPEMRLIPRSGVGSGVIISQDGYIATNNHVVDGADIVTVTLTDGREFTAKVVGRDEQTDIAIIKVDSESLPAVTFADTSKIEVGDRVLAIGNPFGIGETVTSGIVSAKGRHVGILADVQGYEDFIQTDAAINPGNSGGALVDVNGRLVGICTAILSRSGGFQGVGLAVPANMVAQVADSLVRTGKVVRGYLGIGIQNITPALAESFALKSNEGALISDIVPNSPATASGLKEGDVILAINGEPVADANELKLKVSSLAPGTKIDLDVLRDGETKKFTAVSGQRSGIARSEERMGPVSQRDEGALQGVAVGDIDPQARRELEIPPQVKGAVITEVAPDSAAARVGISRGDVILEINKQPVNSAEDAVQLCANAGGKKSLVQLWSRGSKVFVVVDDTDSGKGAS
jgi:serine protease Do